MRPQACSVPPSASCAANPGAPPTGRGGGGRVRLRPGRGGRDVVTDFEDGVDRLRIGAGADRFLQLRLQDRGEDVAIRFADARVVLKDEPLSAIGPEHFAF